MAVALPVQLVAPRRAARPRPRHTRAAHASAAPPPPPPAAGRRAALRLLALTAVLGAARASRAADADADSAASEDGSDPAAFALKGAKIGGILLAADVISAAVLGRSVLGMAKSGAAAEGGDASASQSADWKEKAADALLATFSKKEEAPAEAGAPAAAAQAAGVPGVAAAPAAPHPRVTALLARVRAAQPVPDLRFEDVLDVINDCYTYSPTAFRVGVGSEAENANKAGENEGACRVLAFAKLHGLSKREAVALFAQHAADVAADPGGSSHKNIRGLLAGGMTSLRFEPFAAQPLKPKAVAA